MKEGSLLNGIDQIVLYYNPMYVFDRIEMSTLASNVYFILFYLILYVYEPNEEVQISFHSQPVNA